MTKLRVPFLDLRGLNEPFRDSMHEALDRVLDSGYYLLGQEVACFEQDFAAYCGVKAAVGVGNGMDALSLVLRAWKEQGRLKSGDEVIVPANTYIATVLAVSENGLRPVLVEPDPGSFNLSVDRVLEAISPRTRVLLPVHLYGRMADMPALMRVANDHHLLVLEDCAQAHGASFAGRRAGSWGDAAAFSFYPGKILGALGDGGAVVTNDSVLGHLVRSLANYGSAQKYVCPLRGRNSRLDEIQAAFLRAKLVALDEHLTARRDLATTYLNGIDNPALQLPSGNVEEHAWHLFVVQCNERDDFQQYLAEHGVGTLIHYPIPPHLQEAYKGLVSGSLPVTERLAGTVLSLPMYPGVDVKTVLEACNGYVGKNKTQRCEGSR
jgi:dTDP-4-amino-4,6-dideoxygalactose transaminase